MEISLCDDVKKRGREEGGGREGEGGRRERGRGREREGEGREGEGKGGRDNSKVEEKDKRRAYLVSRSR